jgi:hypothetical protein
VSVNYRFALFATPCFFHVVLMLRSFYPNSFNYSGEFNSNWGRLMRTMRVRLDLPTLQDDGGNSYIDKKAGGVLPKYSKTLDMRIAWGPRTPRLPGQ